MSHKFKVGQHVRQSTIGYADAKSAASSLFEIVRLMPEDRTGATVVPSEIGCRRARSTGRRHHPRLLIQEGSGQSFSVYWTGILGALGAHSDEIP